MSHCLIVLSPPFHCKQLWHLQLQQIHYQVSSLVILTVTLCHRLEEFQEEAVVLCTTKPEDASYLG